MLMGMFVFGVILQKEIEKFILVLAVENHAFLQVRGGAGQKFQHI